MVAQRDHGVFDDPIALPVQIALGAGPTEKTAHPDAERLMADEGKARARELTRHAFDVGEAVDLDLMALPTGCDNLDQALVVLPGIVLAAMAQRGGAPGREQR